MRQFKIACANSRKAARWKNTTITWEALCERLRSTVYTKETSDEYWAMSKDDRDAAKDNGAFVGGSLTHSHMPEKPRYRVVIALEEDISPERYAAVSRYLAAEFGIDQYDPVSFVTNQLMHWPSTSKDAEYICEVIDGSLLNADEYLAGHPGWEDYSNLPMSGREETACA